MHFCKFICTVYCVLGIVFHVRPLKWYTPTVVSPVYGRESLPRTESVVDVRKAVKISDDPIMQMKPLAH